MTKTLEKNRIVVSLLLIITFFATNFCPAYCQENDKPEPPAEAEKDPEDQLQEEIDAAIKRGVDWLLKNQRHQGSFSITLNGPHQLGQNALITLALLKCGVSPDDPAIRKAFKFMKNFMKKKKIDYPTYELSILLMALEAKYYNSALFRKNAERISEGLLTSRPEISKSDYNWAKECAKFLIRIQRKNGGWGYGNETDTMNSSYTDNTNSQYACLGLLAAKRLGVPIPEKAFLNALKYWLDGQYEGNEKVEAFPVPAAQLDSFKCEEVISNKKNTKKTKEKKKESSTSLRKKDRGRTFGAEPTRKEFIARGWSYFLEVNANSAASHLRYPYGSMTVAGVSSLAICKSQLIEKKCFDKKLREKTNYAIEDGAAWLAKHFSVMPNYPFSDWYQFYYLYGLERAGALSGCAKFGEHDWYRESAVELLELQTHEGYWGAPPILTKPCLYNAVDTCFALLFLARATMPVIEEPDGTILTGKDLFKKPKKKEESIKPDSKEKTPKKDEDRAEPSEKNKQNKPMLQNIDATVKKAVEYLLAQQKDNGSYPSLPIFLGNDEYTALVALALLKSGLSPNYPAICKAFKSLKRQKDSTTFGLALLLMALEAKYYKPSVPTKIKVSGSDLEWAKTVAQQIVKLQFGSGDSGPTKYFPPSADFRFLFVCLGLKAASRLGVKIQEEVFLKTLNYWLEGQCKKGDKVDAFLVPAARLDSFEYDKRKKKIKSSHARKTFIARGWGYREDMDKPDYRAYGHITMAGLASLVICKSELAGNKNFEKKLRSKTDYAIEDAAAWLTKYFSIKDIPASMNDKTAEAQSSSRLHLHYYYYMYTLAMAGTLTGCEMFAEHDWYREGSLALLQTQRPDGHWQLSPDLAWDAPAEFSICNTCFALLFLTKATTPVIDPEILSNLRKETEENQKDNPPKTKPEK